MKNGKALRNRIVVPPMASQTANGKGLVTERTLSHYERLAEAAPGLLMVEYTFVHDSGRSEEHQLGIQSDSHIFGLTQLANRIKQSGSIAGIQITHSGGKTERTLTGGVLMGPSAVAVPVKDRIMETPAAMSKDEICLWIDAFVIAVERAVLAGFDLVEFHAAHGYGLNQWLSPITNRREDVYGGDLQGRMRIILKIISTVRTKHPDLLLSVRMPGQDFLEGGITTEEAVEIAQALETAGIDILNVSSGIGGWRRPSPRIGEGYLVNEAAAIQAKVEVPVIGVGGIETGDFIDASLEANRLSLAAIGRAILRDPKQWRIQNLERNQTIEHPIETNMNMA